MTIYTAIPDSDIDPESPGTTTLFTRLRDNPLAIAEGDPTAPDVAYSALSAPTTSSGITQISNFAFESKDMAGIYSYQKVAEFQVSASGTINTYFGLYSITTQLVYGRVYKNGSPVGAERSKSSGTQYFSEDISVVDGDLIQFYSKATTSTSGVSFVLDPKLRASTTIPGSIVRTV